MYQFLCRASSRSRWCIGCSDRIKKSGFMVARKRTLTQEHLRAVGADTIPVCTAGMDNQEEFCEVIIEGRRNALDFNKLENEIVSTAEALV